MLFTTEIHAICPITKELKRYIGEIVGAETKEEAERIIQQSGKGYLNITGEYVATYQYNSAIDTKEPDHNPKEIKCTLF